MNAETQATVNLKVTVTAKRDMLGRRVNAYVVKLGETGWEAQGTCKEGALQLLQWELEQARRNEYRHFYARAQGATFCLFWAGAGWCYEIVRDDAPNRASMSSFASGALFETCRDKMLAHVAQWNECNASVAA